MNFSIGSSVVIEEYTEEEYTEIYDALTLPNPAYEQVLKHSPYSYTKIPKYLFYADSVKSKLIIPRGYNIKKYHPKLISDDRFTLENINYPKPKIELRKTQKEAVDTYISKRNESIKQGKNVDGVIVLPTGKGKSILGLYLAGKLKQRALIIVGKDDLVDGWMEDAYNLYGITPKNVGLIKAKEFRLGKQITITTIQTLCKLPEDKLSIVLDYFSMVIVDEFHHSAAKIYSVVNKFTAIDRIGLTATDKRNDGLEKVLNFYFGNVCYRFKETEEDEDIISAKDVQIVIKNSHIKYLSPPKEYFWSDGEHWGRVRDICVEINNSKKWLKSQSKEWEEKIKELLSDNLIKRKSLNIHEVYNAIDTDFEFNRMVSQDVAFEYKKGKSCLVFCKEKNHVRLLQKLIIESGVPENMIQLYYGDTKGKNVKKLMKHKAESREVLVTIATYSIATEGTNVKEWEVCFLAMTFNNPISAIQAIGRVRRKKVGKTSAKVYDYRHPNIAGAKSHGFTRDRVYKELGFTYLNKSKVNNKLFSKGYNNKF